MCVYVSIPFIAGQWSLQKGTISQGKLTLEGLNPLHCGAVVASPNHPFANVTLGFVSIPFIAGQWSLQPRKEAKGVTFTVRLNPLHCGAVVASLSLIDAFVKGWGTVSIPFIAGQWSLHVPDGSGSLRCSCVSIPFIAGQWSLPLGIPSSLEGRQHVSIPFIAGQWSLRLTS